MSGDATTGRVGKRRLDEHLSFALYSANLAFGRAYKHTLSKLGLTYTQFITLVALQDGSPQTVRTLGLKLYLGSNTLTPVLKKLEKMGHVERARDPEDERQMRILLSQSGRRLISGSLLSASPVNIAGLTLEEVERLYEAIVKMRNELVSRSDVATVQRA